MRVLFVELEPYVSPVISTVPLMLKIVQFLCYTVVHADV